MLKKKITTEGGVPVFSGEEFFRPGERCYIHMSNSLPEYVGVPHKHKFIEIVYVISGAAEHVTDRSRYPVKKGDLIIINYETTHAFYAAGGDEPFVSYDLMFTPDFLDPSLFRDAMFESLSSSLLFYSLFPEQETLGPDLQLSGAGYAAIGELFNRIYLEYAGQDTGYVNMIRACVIELIVMILRRLNKLRDELAPRQEELIRQAISYLGEHYAAQVGLAELAAKVFLNKDYFGRLFRDVTGMSVGAYLAQYRVNEACRLLSSTDMKINRIAAACGYNDMKNFYKSFRRLTGSTPGAYRRAHSTEPPAADADRYGDAQ